jgi:hypothetical protein
MGIRPVSRIEFDEYQPARAPESQDIFEEKEWFADDGGIVIGLIALDKADKDWFIGVLGRDERGTFRAIDVESSIESIDAARLQLIAMMEKLVATGRAVFPQEH